MGDGCHRRRGPWLWQSNPIITLSPSPGLRVVERKSHFAFYKTWQKSVKQPRGGWVDGHKRPKSSSAGDIPGSGKHHFGVTSWSHWPRASGSQFCPICSANERRTVFLWAQETCYSEQVFCYFWLAKRLALPPLIYYLFCTYQSWTTLPWLIVTLASGCNWAVIVVGKVKPIPCRENKQEMAFVTTTPPHSILPCVSLSQGSWWRTATTTSVATSPYLPCIVSIETNEICSHSSRVYRAAIQRKQAFAQQILIKSKRGTMRKLRRKSTQLIFLLPAFVLGFEFPPSFWHAEFENL